jgi:molybdate transport system regulatory protein
VTWTVRHRITRFDICESKSDLGQRAASNLLRVKWAMAAKPQLHFRMRITKGDDIALGPGKIDLLEAIDATGSITAAARQLGMSYRRAWMLVETMNRCFRQPVVDAETGGKHGGGTRLTDVGKDVVSRYREIERQAARANAVTIRALMRLL